MKSYKSVCVAGEQIRVHRHIMEQHLGRKLLTSELVHHKDGDKNNNDIENLEVVSRGNHMKMHNIGVGTRFQLQYRLSKLDLIQVYLVERLPIHKVAKRLNATYGSVWRALKKYGIVRELHPCRICKKPSMSTTQDLCSLCYHKEYNRRRNVK